MTDIARYETLEVRVEDRIGYVLLNRPAKRNALSTALLRELAAVARWFDSVSEVRAVVISGAGDHFSAGADLEAFSGPAAAKELVMTCRPFDAAEARSR